MDNLCFKLKALLENTYSMPFDVFYKIIDGEMHFICNPSNEEQMFFEIKVYIHNNIRLNVEIYPQKYGGYILNEMASATLEKQDNFFSYKKMLVEQGVRISFLVNQSEISQDKTWPSRWKSLSVKMTLSPIPESEKSDLNIIFEWFKHSINIIFSLITITERNEETNDIGLLCAAQTEGTMHIVKSIRYERNPINRQLCLYKKGYACSVCGMNFYDIYGEIGKNFIEVHHTTPVSQMGKGYVLDIDRDLVPVCSNCHSMIHRKDPPYTINELKSIIEENNYGTLSYAAESDIAYNQSNPKNLIVGVVKSDLVQSFKKSEAKFYYFGRNIPTRYNFKNIEFFAPYYEGGIWGYYEIKGIRTSSKSKLLGKQVSNDDIRLVLDLGLYHPLKNVPLRVKLTNYTYANLSLNDLIQKTDNKIDK